ncbi:class I adenylate-forming enzyme family protein, partial [Loktanella sp. SALINAS62]|uniref:class I adenylate-forming enzyme family protein n=1 Tax=Loktanella sp. SALINAS62 TaxID=2706124 RepID=UPI001B8BE09E
ALIVPGTTTLTFSDLEKAVRGTATGLLEHARPGDIVLMRLANTPDFPITYLACITAGLIPVPTSAQLTATEVAGIVHDLSPALCVHDPAVTGADVPTISIATLRSFVTRSPADYAMGDPHRPAYIVYTSGTSGTSRAVVHAHRAIWARRMMWDGWCGLMPDDRLLHAGAFNWTYTLGTGLMDPWANGATAIIPAPDTDASALPDLLQLERATIFAAAPGVYRRILRAPLPDLPALRHGLSAGEKLPETLRTAWETATGKPIHEAFGMSECSTFLSGSPNRPAPSGTLGYPQPGRRVTIMDDGQIAIHRSDPGLMLGYHNQPDETAARYRGEWFLTGDHGTQGDDGAITYTGRADDQMNAGGHRVSPVEIESALSHHPAITDIACAEVRLSPDLSLIAAFYVASDLLDETDLSGFAQTRLAAYKRPRLWVRVDALPRGANNKVLRRKLRQDWETTHGQA